MKFALYRRQAKVFDSEHYIYRHIKNCCWAKTRGAHKNIFEL